MVAALEFEEAFLITAERLEELRLEVGIKSSTAMVAKRLRDRGWLLETPQRGVRTRKPLGGYFSRKWPLITVESGHPLQVNLASDYG